MNENNLDRVPIPPHVYPRWIKVSLVFLGIMFIYTFLLIPKVLRVRKNVQLSDYYFHKADILFKANKFDEAIPLYKEGLYLSWEKKPEKLAICYLHQSDSLSLYQALGLLSTVETDSIQIMEILRVLPQKYQSYINRSHIVYKKEIISTTYLFNFSTLEKEDPEEYERIKLAKNEFQKFRHSNPNN